MISLSTGKLPIRILVDDLTAPSDIMLAEAWQMMSQKVAIGVTWQMFREVVQTELVTFDCFVLL
jgi:hypothetical protein